MAYEKIANLKGPKGLGVTNPRVDGNDLIFDLTDGTETVGTVNVGNVRGARGIQGIQGDDGPTGPAPQMMLQVEALPNGAAPTVWQSGTDEEPVITLGIPSGDEGEEGPAGPVPLITFSARALPSSAEPTVTRVGGSDEAPAVEIGIPRGDEGDAGPSPTLIFEQPLNLAPGSQPLVNVSQPRPGEYRLQLGLVQGPAGTATESIRDDQISVETAWSSQKVRTELDALIDDSDTDTDSAWSSQKTAAEIAAGATTELPWGAVTGKPASFPPAAHAHTYESITGKPSSFPPSAHTHAWSAITGRPSTFAPSAHTHASSDITGRLTDAQLPTRLGVAEITEQVERSMLGTAGRGDKLALLRQAMIDPTLRCVVVVTGSSTFRAQSARIGVMDRLAAAAGSTTFPLLDSLSSAPGAGMQWLQGAEGGTSTGNYLPEARLQKIALANPNYVFHGIGSNDYAAGTQRPLVQYKANLREKLQRIAADSPGVVQILVHQQGRPDQQGRPIGWEQYGQAMAEVAAENDDWLFVNLSALLDSYGISRVDNRFGVVASDNVHPSNTGHRLLAKALGGALGIPVADTDWVELHDVPLIASATHSASVKLGGIVLPQVAYPRLVTVDCAIYHAVSANTSANYVELQVGVVGNMQQQRLTPGSGQNLGTQIGREYYLPPWTSVEYQARIAVSGSATAYVSGGTTYSLLQVTERPY